MTTTVKVEAHCAEDKQVIVCISGDHKENIVLKDGENWEGVIYQGRHISISETD